ncbi:MAG: hypothetical protein LUC83_01175 [Clostridiales bacterium]|nr:hypothetical protein [Clostridiales bacterium]
MRDQHVKGKKKKRRGRQIACLAVLIVLAAAGVLFAKYRSGMQRQAQMISENFHISSNYLEVESENASHTVSNWSSGFSIELYNYEKENVAQVAAEDIFYEISLSDTSGKIADNKISEYFTVSVTDADNTASYPNDGKYTLSTNISGEGTYHTLTITPVSGASISGEVSLKVTVTSTAPFAKTLAATFQLAATQQPDYTVTQAGVSEGSYALVTIHSNGYEGTISVTWDNDLSPDNDNEIMRAWYNSADDTTTETFTSSTYTTYELIFFNPSGKAIKTVDDESGSNITVSVK